MCIKRVWFGLFDAQIRDCCYATKQAVVLPFVMLFFEHCGLVQIREDIAFNIERECLHMHTMQTV